MLQHREVAVSELISETVFQITVSADWSYLFSLPVEDNIMRN